jgi:glycosyltransferase involved in cell wall biosynthesis
MKVFFISDHYVHWIKEEFIQQGFTPIEMVYPSANIDITKKSLNMKRLHRILFLHTKYLKLAFQSLVKAKKNDIIICWLDVIAIYVLLLSCLSGKRRKIIAVNVMFNENTSILTKIKKECMRWLLSNKNIYPTITSVSLSQYYKDIFNLPSKEFFVLHDTYGTRRERLQNIKCRTQSEKYVFCGGTNGRDWNAFTKIAQELPNINFIAVGNRKNILGENYPANIQYHYNIPYQQFLELFANAAVLVLPLNTEAPAGLIVLLEGALLSKAIVTTDNVTMREYVVSGENGFLIKKGDYKEFAEKVNEVFSNEQIQKSFGENLKKAIIEKCSPEVYVSTLIKIINQVKTIC